MYSLLWNTAEDVKLIFISRNVLCILINMNVLTIAFIFQFILSLWPKSGLIYLSDTMLFILGIMNWLFSVNNLSNKVFSPLKCALFTRQCKERDAFWGQKNCHNYCWSYNLCPLCCVGAAQSNLRTYIW